MFRTRRIIQLSTNLVRRLSNKSCNLMNYNISLSQKLGQPRNIHTSSLLKGTSTYEGEGKTTVHILNNEADLAIMINGVSQVGFRLNNEMTVLGPMLIFPRSVLSWNVDSVNDINEDSLAIFSILEPKVDILVLGVGDAIEDTSIYRRLLPLAHKLRLSMEILPTEQACSTFNFLASEGRFAVGALIPPKTLIASDDDIVQTKLRYQNIYEIDEPVKFV